MKFGKIFFLSLGSRAQIHVNSLNNLHQYEFQEKYCQLLSGLRQFISDQEWTLHDFSIWFEKLSNLNSEQSLEIPGQYTGSQKPLPETHIKIINFDRNILILKSIRKPKKITIRGHNEKDYKFLVKGDEDLRLDQRVEQLFGLMNSIYFKDSVCSHLNLHLITYQVIPLNRRLGLLEWVEDTLTLDEFLHLTLTDVEKRIYISGIQAECFKWNKSQQNHDSIYLTKTANDIIQYHRKRISNVPKNLFRQSFMRLSSSLESYFILRNTFLMSHAVLCASHYILGIGDRHLSNFMVSQVSGKVVGIDFGHSFGSATQFLPIPELMPFRLTNQFTQFMEPLGKSSIFHSVMVHALRALRNSPDILLSTMDIFIKEPTLDWQELARKQLNTEGETDKDEADLSWYPREKVTIAKKKLTGWNPSHITMHELSLGHKKKKAYKKYVEVCLGDKHLNIRSQKPLENLKPEDQMECLVDQATDERLLGLAFIGWSPWM